MSTSKAPGAPSSQSSRSKRELIDRIRYPNPIPLPPYPPKLVSINTDPARYSNPHFGDRLASSNLLPVIVDAQAGMPINLAHFQDIWEGDLSEVTPPDHQTLDHEQLDDADAFLLQDFTAALPGASASSGAAQGAVGLVTSLHASGDFNAQASLAAAAQHRHAQSIGPNAKTTLQAEHVTWLRRTEYLSAEQKKAQQQAQKPRQVEMVDTSRDAQIAKIEQSFKEAQKPLKDLSHPTKRGVTAVQSFELLPDPETWATDYQIVRFIDPPGRISNGVPVVDPRLDVALFRPVSDANTGEQRVSYYLPTGEDLPDDVEEPLALIEDQNLEDEKSRRLRKRRRTGKVPNSDQVPRNQSATAFKWVRDYVPKDTAESSHDILLLSLDDGVPDPDPDADIDPISGTKRKAGAAAGIDEDDDEDLFGGDDDDDQDADQAETSTAIPQSEHERQKRSRRSELTKGKERSEQPEGSGVSNTLNAQPKAYYHKIGMRFTLRVWRSRATNNEKLRNRDRRYPGKWDLITLSHRDMSEREQLRRLHLRRQVDDLGEIDPYESSADEAEEDAEEHDAQAEGEEQGAGDRVLEEDDDEDEAAHERAQGSDAGSPAPGAASDAEERAAEAPDGDEEGGNNHDDEDDDDEDDDDDDDEEGTVASIDADEELAALKEEAQGAGDEDEAQEGGRRSRSRRAAATASTENPSRDVNEADEGAMDVDNTDE